MSQKRKFAAKFTLPSAAELDTCIGNIQSGSKFNSSHHHQQSSASRDAAKDLDRPKIGPVSVGSKELPSTDFQNHKVPEGNVCSTGGSTSSKIDGDSKNSSTSAKKDNYIGHAPNTGLKENISNSEANDLTKLSDHSQSQAAFEKTGMSDVPLPMKKSSTNSIIVSARQRGNPVLKHIRNIPWEFGEVIPDYVLGKMSCALFLSLRYHNFNPEYIHDRLKQLGNRYELRILLVQVDVKDPHASLKELAKICILANCTLMLAWSMEEAGRYLETYKSYENKPADILQERVEGDYQSKITECLTSVKSVNRTDAVTLVSNFGSLKNIVNASKEEISMCPGFGPQKADRLYKIFREPCKKKNKVNESLVTETTEACSRESGIS